VRRRRPRGAWLYTICAILVVLYALSVLYGIGAEASSPRLSDFLAPALWLSFPLAVALIGRVGLKVTIGMRKRFLGFTFEGESYWIVAMLLIPLLGILLGIVILGLWRRWFS
jgi:hypothetical protein